MRHCMQGARQSRPNEWTNAESFENPTTPFTMWTVNPSVWTKFYQKISLQYRLLSSWEVLGDPCAKSSFFSGASGRMNSMNWVSIWKWYPSGHPKRERTWSNTWKSRMERNICLWIPRISCTTISNWTEVSRRRSFRPAHPWPFWTVSPRRTVRKSWQKCFPSGTKVCHCEFVTASDPCCVGARYTPF